MTERYPEHQKLKAVKHESQAIGEFLEWLSENEMQICKIQPGEFIRHGGYEAVRDSTEQLLARFFEIDLKKISDEKDAMLEELRSA